jgi:hypothetical protein
MNSTSHWEDESGVKVLRFYSSKRRPDWPRPADRTDLFPPCPRVVALDLDSKQFEEFSQGPLEFSIKYNLYPDQKILWMSPCAMPPVGRGIPAPAPGTRWIVVYNHTCESLATCAACPQTTTKTRRRRARK